MTFINIDHIAYMGWAIGIDKFVWKELQQNWRDEYSYLTLSFYNVTIIFSLALLGPLHTSLSIIAYMGWTIGIDKFVWEEDKQNWRDKYSYLT